jgi:hypothetical protein
MLPRMNRFLIVFLAAVLLAVVACKHTDKAEQLAALDNAYQSGLLTGDEYEAKRLALTGGATGAAPPATTPAAIAPGAAAPAPSAVSAPSGMPPAVVVRRSSPAAYPASKPHHAPVQPIPAPSPRHVEAPPSAPQVASSTPPAPPANASSDPPSADNAKAREPAPLAGCEDMDYKSGGTKGAEERFFAAAPEVVRGVALSALDSLDFNIQKNSNEEIEASKKRHVGVIVGAGGERVILTFHEAERGGKSGTSVVGKTKKSFVGHVAQRTWTDAVLAQIACRLRETSR